MYNENEYDDIEMKDFNVISTNKISSLILNHQRNTIKFLSIEFDTSNSKI
jgi:hypothetical protein